MGKHLLKLTRACWLALIGWMNPGWTADVADRCQQLCKNGQYEQAFPVCSKAAEQGDAAAQYNLGWMYRFGKGVQQNYSKAVKWYRKAAEQGGGVPLPIQSRQDVRFGPWRNAKR